MQSEQYESIFEHIPHAFAYHQILTGSDGKPADYLYLAMNPAFEAMTGLRRSETLNRRVTEILPGIEKSAFSWIDAFGQVALNGESASFIQYSPELERWYDVTAFSDKPGFFGVLFREITQTEDFFNLARDLMCIADTDGHFIRANQAWGDILGYPPDDLSGRSFLDFVHPDDRQDTLDALAALSQQQPVLDFTNRYRSSDGSYRIIEWRSQPKGRLVYAAARDITRQKAIEEQIYSDKEQFKTTLLSVGDGILAADQNGRIQVINEVAARLTGWSAEEAMEQPFSDVVRIIREHSRLACPDPVQEVFRTGLVSECDQEVLLVSRDGHEIPIENRSAPIRSQAGQITGVVSVIRDCTDKRERQREVEFLSFHDHLTGLYNRRYYEDALSRLDTPRNWPIAILVIDINGLKLTNDAYGHDMGDRLICAASEILHRACRSDDILARTGGDEFVILLPQTSREQAAAIKQRISRLAADTRLESVIISMAVGFAVKAEASQDIHDVLREADNRMYRDKLKYSRMMRSQTIETVLRQINNKYDHEQVHTEKVAEYCEAIARAQQMSEREIHEIRTVGILHDIGKIAVPPELLRKAEKLTDDEWDQIKGHAATSYNILKSVDEYAAFAEAVLHHHERWDGKGYPAGLAGEAIPLYARIVAIADAYEAMTSQRPYQKTRTRDEALAELCHCAGKQFDPDLTEVFVKLMSTA